MDREQLHLRLPDLERLARLQHELLLALPDEPRAVRAAQVLHLDHALRKLDLRVAARGLGVAQYDVALFAAEDDGPLREAQGLGWFADVGDVELDLLLHARIP